MVCVYVPSYVAADPFLGLTLDRDTPGSRDSGTQVYHRFISRFRRLISRRWICVLLLFLTRSQVELCWRTTMGESGSVLSAPVVFEASDRREVEVIKDCNF